MRKNILFILSITIFIISILVNVFLYYRINQLPSSIKDNHYFHGNKNWPTFIDGFTSGEYIYNIEDKNNLIKIFQNYDIFQYSHIDFDNKIYLETYLNSSFPKNKTTITFTISGYYKQEYKNEFSNLYTNYPTNGINSYITVDKNETTKNKFIISSNISFPHFVSSISDLKTKDYVEQYGKINMEVAQKLFEVDAQIYKTNCSKKINIDTHIITTLLLFQIISLIIILFIYLKKGSPYLQGSR